jgi:hypothetical protein
MLAPESCLPDEYLLLDCTEHDQDQTDGGELREDSKGYGEPAGQLSDTKEAGECRTLPDTRSAGDRVPGMAPATGHEDEAYQQPHHKERGIAVAIQPLDGQVATFPVLLRRLPGLRLSEAGVTG